MARIRYIKPEFFSDTTIADLTPLARLFYIGIWCQMDRQGIVEDDVKLLKHDIFPYDDALTQEVVSALLEELIAKERLVRFQHGAKRLLICPKFEQHQKFHINEKPKYRIPKELLPAPCSSSACSIGIGIGTGIRIGIGTGNGNENGDGNGERGTGTDDASKIQAANEKLIELRSRTSGPQWRKA